MTRPLRYRTDLNRGIGQHKFRADPLTVEEVLGGIMVIGFTLFMIVLLFNLEAPK